MPREEIQLVISRDSSKVRDQALRLMRSIELNDFICYCVY